MQKTSNVRLPLRHPNCLLISLYSYDVFHLIWHRSYQWRFLHVYIFIFAQIPNYSLTFQMRCSWVFIVSECVHITHCSKKLTISKSINSAIELSSDSMSRLIVSCSSFKYYAIVSNITSPLVHFYHKVKFKYCLCL